MHFRQNDATAPGDRPHSSEAGFSIIEGLIAALLLLVVTLGILPLFSRAMNNNLKGNDSTRRSNAAIDSFEAQQGLLFNSGAMTVQPATTATVVLETLALMKIASPSGGSVGIVPWILLDTDGQSAVRRRAARAFLALRERALTH